MMELSLNKYRNALTIGLNKRMRHCQQELAEIAIQEDLKIIDDIAFSSESLKKHFSIKAYKSMKSAQDKILKGPSTISFGYFDINELVQLVKAVGDMASEHGVLTNFLVDNLMFETYKHQ